MRLFGKRIIFLEKIVLVRKNLSYLEDYDIDSSSFDSISL